MVCLPHGNEVSFVAQQQSDFQPQFHAVDDYSYAWLSCTKSISEDESPTSSNVGGNAELMEGGSQSVTRCLEVESRSRFMFIEV